MIESQLKQIEFERRELKLQNAQKQQYILSNVNKEKLHITYVMTWTGVCGGTKIILEHADQLIQRGHKITLISHDKKPMWFFMNKKIEFIEVPREEVLCEKIPQCDLIITTYWREIYEAIEQKIAPVIYFEQGDYHLFELQKLDNRTKDFIQKQLDIVDFVYTVSTFAQEKLMEVYKKDSIVIPNAVQDKIFFYEPHKQNEEVQITVIGSEESKFKCIDNILEAIEKVKNKGYKLQLNWITPTQPTKNKIQAIVNPAQIVIGNILRKTDIFICASIYESFCLPVLEAMTCGAAIITTNNGGNMDFVRNKENALVIEKDNIDDIVEKIEILINNEKMRNELILEALKTAKRYSWNITIEKIIEYYEEVANYHIK